MTRSNGAEAVAIFSRLPVAGQTKTRLIGLLGRQGAARLHEQLLLKAVTQATQACKHVTLWLTEIAPNPFVERLQADFACAVRQQAGADLGQRMKHALRALLEEHHKAVLIGSDCPAVNAQTIAQAFEALNTNDMVFAPAEDGGYVMVGAARCHDAAFDQIPWSTADVMAITRQRLNAAAVPYAELPLTWDIDRPEDYLRAVNAGLIAPVSRSE